VQSCLACSRTPPSLLPRPRAACPSWRVPGHDDSTKRSPALPARLQPHGDRHARGRASTASPRPACPALQEPVAEAGANATAASESDTCSHDTHARPGRCHWLHLCPSTTTSEHESFSNIITRKEADWIHRLLQKRGPGSQLQITAAVVWELSLQNLYRTRLDSASVYRSEASCQGQLPRGCGPTESKRAWCRRGEGRSPRRAG
jgi:hypothetical protein